ncbi:MAG: DUF4159 domain-containing protein [Deltaproteobacteria bacterium]|nr:DUF4159 domain-containing protein [Deltaproteobacteria bacterium]
MSRPTRRELLTAAAALGATALVPRRAEAIGEPPVGAARLVIPGLRNPRPGAVATLMKEVRDNSSVVTAEEVTEVAPGASALFDHPFVTLLGAEGFAPLSDAAVANLRLYLREGGFLFIDDSSGVRDSDFDASVRRDLARILPGGKLARIGREHAVYRSFFLMRGASGRIMVKPYLEGLWVGDITPVLYSANDLMGAWMVGADGRWQLEVVPGGDNQRTQARRLGLNLVLFGLTSNYKRDAVHVRTLLDRMRRQGGYAE